VTAGSVELTVTVPGMERSHDGSVISSGELDGDSYMWLTPNGQKVLLTTYSQQKTLIKRPKITFYKKVIIEL